MNIHAQCSIYVNQQAVNAKQFIISNRDNIEIFISGSGGGRPKRGSGIHPDYECTTCSICSKDKPDEYFIHLQTSEQNQQHDFVQLVQSKYPRIGTKYCICKSCKNKLIRQDKYSEDTTPKKRKTHTCLMYRVSGLSCTNDGIICSFSTDNIMKCYDIDESNRTLIDTPDVTLCKSHYTHVWKFMNVKNVHFAMLK